MKKLVLLRGDQLKNTTKEMAEEFRRAYREDLCGLFPYADCWTLLKKAVGNHEGLVPDLDMYFYGIASSCGGARHVLAFPPDRLRELRESLTTSFFDRHPEHRDLELLTTAELTPYLHRELLIHEALRNRLLLFIDLLLAEAAAES